MRTLKFPDDILRFLYWVFFKPFTFEKYVFALFELSPDSIDRSRSWRIDPYRSLLLLTLFHMSVTPLLLSALTTWSFNLIGLVIPWYTAILTPILGLVLNYPLTSRLIFGSRSPDETLQMVAGASAFSIVWGFAGGFVIGIFTESPSDPQFSLGNGALLSIVWAGVIGILMSVWTGKAPILSWGLLLAATPSILIAVELGARGSAQGVPAVLAILGMSIISYFGGYFRILPYIFESAVQSALILLYMSESAVQSAFSSRDYNFALNVTVMFRLSPIYWDEMIWPPLFGLDTHLIEIGKQDRQSVQRAIEDTKRSFHQQWAARNALVKLTAHAIVRAQTTREIASINDQFDWLPTALPNDLEEILPPIREIADYARAAVESETLYNKQTQLRNARAQTHKVREGLVLSRDRKLAAWFARTLELWENVFDRELASLQAEEVIPNVYVAGSPLSRNSKVFKGRQDLFVTLERELTSSAEQRPTLLLLGARRTGKTSAIKQMPVRLGPDVIPVEIDLQSAAMAKDILGLLSYLADQIKLNALNYRRLQLPVLARAQLQIDPYMAFLDWLNNVEERIGERWILLNLDEYEHLVGMMEAGRLDERVFQFLRGLIQHHPRVAVLLSGSHSLLDLPPIWSDYLVNVRLLRIGVLKPEEARELIVEPVPDFPIEYENSAVNRILSATGRQPFLVQATCRDLVNTLNEQKRLHATLSDADCALDSVLTTGATYFQEQWSGHDTDDAKRIIMRTIAEQADGRLSEEKMQRQLNALESKALHQLMNREILDKVDGAYCFRIELMQQWVRRQIL
jgi:hypothetical protein